jgi:hypothetical protein
MGFTNIFKGNSGGAIALSPKDDRPAPALSLLVLEEIAQVVEAIAQLQPTKML